MQSQDRSAVIGSQTHVTGDIAGTESLTIAGRVQGNIRLGDTLVVESSAVVSANIHARTVIIHGTVIGDITADELVHLAEEARVVGDLVSPRLILAEGAAYRGSVNLPEKSTPAAAAPPAGHRRGDADSPSDARTTRASGARTTRPTVRLDEDHAAAPPAAPAPRSGTRPPTTRSGRNLPRPPTTAGKKSRVKRK